MKVKIGTSKSFFNTLDKKLLGSIFFLILVGIYSVYSNYLNSETMIPFQKHLSYVVWGIIIMFVVTFTSENWLRSIAFPFYILNILLLIAVLLFGVEINGTKG
ncbi:MAG: FtsW/RodA/SpoVE family cell cycle protein, partial [Candidatus Kapaibacteriota bacterium]